MATSQTAITREVRRWMQAERYTQADVAQHLGINQTKVSNRLRGITRWSIDDIDRLRDMGVPVAITVYGEAAMSGAER